MKTIFHGVIDIVYATISLLLLSGCYDSDVIRSLDSADSLLDSYPDSAFAILKTIDSSNLHSSEEKARYSILYFAAAMKSGESMDSDSILNTAINYYEDRKVSSREKMLTHFFHAIYLVNQNKNGKALKEYDNAIEAASEIGDNLYTGLANINKGVIYGRNNIEDEEMEYTRKGLDLIKLTGDTARIIQTHINYGVAGMHNSHYSLANENLTQALKLSDEFGADPQVKADILLQLAAVAVFDHKTDEAEIFYVKAYQVGHDYFETPDWGLLGQHYVETGNIAKARECLDSVVARQSVLVDTITRFHLEKIINSSSGNYKEAVAFADSVQKYENRWTELKLKQSVLHQEKEILRKDSSFYKELARKEWEIIILSISLSVVVLSGIIAITVFLFRKKSRKMRRLVYAISNKAVELEKTTADLEKKDSLLSTLTRLIDNQRSQNNELEKAKEGLENRLSELTNDIYAHRQNEESFKDEIENLKFQLSQSDSQVDIMQKIVDEAKKGVVDSYRSSNDSVSNAMILEIMDNTNIKEENLSELKEKYRLRLINSEQISKMERSVNKLMENVLSRILSEFNLNDRERHILAFTLSGYNYRFIACILQMKPSTLSSIKSRLLNKILNSESAHSDLYHKYLGDQTYNKM